MARWHPSRYGNYYISYDAGYDSRQANGVLFLAGLVITAAPLAPIYALVYGAWFLTYEEWKWKPFLCGLSCVAVTWFLLWALYQFFYRLNPRTAGTISCVYCLLLSSAAFSIAVAAKVMGVDLIGTGLGLLSAGYMGFYGGSALAAKIQENKP